MTEHIKRIRAIGIHGRYDYEYQFQDGVNIIYGKNGTGKTTLIHILANILYGDYERFIDLNFQSIQLEFSNDTSIIVERTRIPHEDHDDFHIHIDGEPYTETPVCPRERDRMIDRTRRARLRGQDVQQWPIFSKTLEKSHDEQKYSVAYFPAFRTVIDAWAANQDEFRFNYPNYPIRRRSELRHQAEKTEFARELFGHFVPRIEYPATIEIELELNQQIRQAIANVSQADRTHFLEVPNRILALLPNDTNPSTDTQEILEDIKSLSLKFQEYPIQGGLVWDRLRESVESVPKKPNEQRVTSIVLSAYREAFRAIVKTQEESFSQIERYLASVNSFFEKKNIEISTVTSSSPNVPSIVIKFDGDHPISPIRVNDALSSGERQILTLIYAATQMNQKDVVLIDEPEISLHVDWQRKLLPAMAQQMPSKQLIVFTHSPIIGTTYRRDRVQELLPRLTQDPDIDFNLDDVDDTDN